MVNIVKIDNMCITNKIDKIYQIDSDNVVVDKQPTLTVSVWDKN